MCDSAADCAEADDPLAVALWRSKRPAWLTVVCPERDHRLAAIYDLPGTGLTLVQPARRYQDGHSLSSHVHTALESVADITAYFLELRCRCGSFDVLTTELGASPAPDPPSPFGDAVPRRAPVTGAGSWYANHRVDAHGRATLTARLAGNRRGHRDVERIINADGGSLTPLEMDALEFARFLLDGKAHRDVLRAEIRSKFGMSTDQFEIALSALVSRPEVDRYDPDTIPRLRVALEQRLLFPLESP